MNPSLILWPVLAQILLTIAMYVLLGVRKNEALKLGQVNRRETALDNRAWPANVVKVSNNIANQFELPVLFYVLCLLLFSVQKVGWLALVLAWVFVVSRYLHAAVHTGKNVVPLRTQLFVVGLVCLLLLTFLAAWHLVAAALV
ncbi:MAPEG family protein [Marinobacter nanhaiticus D15-8W]|uniref:MAPEG family protein n=1 Tax=Marinobacter nanhaiticus D15-8W TaxID=626887 RepID=N6W4V3_9GAMM|nr:MAPEG family protein [Marinobacter nanhaiticus]ENO15184.1 hypothetical protein J057_07536 [Marinobacter nanhaiticus D15-8W]BES69114.1 MAPEG family protein [Marinobacter nanhaiticus D15-8W]